MSQSQKSNEQTVSQNLDKNESAESPYTRFIKEYNDLIIIAVGILIGVLATILYASQVTSWKQFTHIVGVASIIACAALLLGGLIGFLFGIPRTLQQNKTNGAQQAANAATAASAAGAADKTKSQQALFQENTNLDQISDWLTKILVGVGLTQITQIPKFMQQYADYTAVSLGNFPSSRVFSAALLVYFLIGGFLVGYLMTRLHLLGALIQANLAARFSQVEDKVSEYKNDSLALRHVQRQLNPASDAAEVSADELKAAIKNASSQVKAQIYYMAAAVRRDNWEDIKNKPVMERTIPIFQALAEADTGGLYHTNHGQLGFALKDKVPPDYKGAEAELTKAINLRDKRQEKGWLIYEFNRLICKIEQDPGYIKSEPSSEEAKKNILDDLTKASKEARIMSKIEKDDAISKWLKINNITAILK